MVQFPVNCATDCNVTNLAGNKVAKFDLKQYIYKIIKKDKYMHYSNIRVEV